VKLTINLVIAIRGPTVFGRGFYISNRKLGTELTNLRFYTISAFYARNDTWRLFRRRGKRGRSLDSVGFPLRGFCRFRSSAEQQDAEKETGQHDLAAEGE
jgi:hypothetical protein